MKYVGNLVRYNDEGIIEERQPLQDNRVERISELFPHLSRLEQFVLSDVLDSDQIEELSRPNYPTHFNKTPIAHGVNQYINYLSHKETWEKRKLAEKSGRRIRPFSFSCDRNPE